MKKPIEVPIRGYCVNSACEPKLVSDTASPRLSGYTALQINAHWWHGANPFTLILTVILLRATETAMFRVGIVLHGARSFVDLTARS